MPKLNRKQLFGFNLSYPQLSEQHRIVATLESLQEKADKLKRLQAETTAKLDNTVPMILERAFKGEL
jgi:restriction endonuclease S subunit